MEQFDILKVLIGTDEERKENSMQSETIHREGEKDSVVTQKPFYRTQSNPIK